MEVIILVQSDTWFSKRKKYYIHRSSYLQIADDTYVTENRSYSYNYEYFMNKNMVKIQRFMPLRGIF